MPAPQLPPSADAFAAEVAARRHTPIDVDAMLANMAAEGRKTATEMIGRGSYPSVRPPAKVRYSHDAMARLLLENPWMHQNDLAAYFGRSPGWISTIITCDAFQAHYASLQAEMLDPELQLTLRERFKALTEQSLRVLQEKLSKPADQVSEQLALRAADLGAKSLGLGGNAPAPAAPNPAEYLPALAERLLRLQGGARQGVSDAKLVYEAADLRSAVPQQNPDA
jgi:hypothetical protein